MKIRDLGFNEWFEQKLNGSNNTNYCIARVTSVNRGSYLVRGDDGEVLAELAGEFVHSMETKLRYPVVGDWAFIKYHNANMLAIIHDLLPRKTTLRRKASGKNIDYQMIASNVDMAFIVQSCDFNFSLSRLERYLVMISEGHIEPIILLSKGDLISKDELERKVLSIRNTGVRCKVISYSAKTGSGLTQIQHVLKPGMTYCLLGSSGVGKTTLLNHLVGRDVFETNIVREKDSKGRHTTSRRQLVVLGDGAILIDTPGMRELGNIGVDSGIRESFSDIVELSKCCRFGNCTHTHEVGCSVLGALRSGGLDEVHYEDYLKLKKESEHYQMSYLERRRKEKKMGQYIKSVGKWNKKK